MAVFETSSPIPHGAYAFLSRLRASIHALDGSSTPPKVRAWAKRHDFVTCQRAQAPRPGAARPHAWMYEITTSGRRFLDDLDRQDALPHTGDNAG